uniref:Uncharacterized protein n=1 Tax=Micromonas pusilla TaxID=38833 RepID=A0A7S0KTQ8_MICPS
MIQYSHYPCRSHHVLAAQSVGSRLELAAADDCDLRLGVPLRGPLLLHRQNHVGALEHLPEHYVFSVEVRRRLRRDEELRPVGVRPGVGHGEQKRLVVVDAKRLVLELLP